MKKEITNDLLESEPTRAVQLPDGRWVTEKLARLWMQIRYPVTIISDRYHGCYSGAEWLAFPLERDEVPEDVCGEDMEEMTFWDYYTGLVGKGATPDAAYADLVEKVAEISNSNPK